MKVVQLGLVWSHPRVYLYRVRPTDPGERILEMTKLVLATVCVLIIAMTTSSLAQRPEGIRLVGKVGMVNTILNSDEIKDGDGGFGFSLGGGIIIPFARSPFTLQGEVNYVDKRSWVRVQEGDSPGSTLAQFELQFEYFDIPVMLNWNFTQEPELLIYLQGGAMASILASAQVEDQSSGEIVKEKIDDEMKDAVFGALVGAGLQAGRIVVEIRYNIGVTGVGEIQDTGKPRIDTLNFLFGFVF
jgi:hypothetical protein